MKIGIALGGGGAKGYAHIGVLKILKEEGLDFDIVTGTSIGAFVGAVYSDGGLEKLEDLVLKIKISDLPAILTPAFSKKGLLTGNYLRKFLKKVLDVENIEDLPKIYSALAVDINTAELISFTKGSIIDAIRASIAIPGLFTPVVKDKRFLVDGGVLEPVPVKTARSLGADKVIAVDLISNFRDFEKDKGLKNIVRDIPFQTELEHISEYIKNLGKAFYIMDPKNKKAFSDKTILDIFQRISIVTQSKLIEQSLTLNPPDIIISPDVSDIGILDFHRARAGIKDGVEAAKQILPEIRKILN